MAGRTVRVEAVHRLFPGLQPRRPAKQPAQHQQAPSPPQQRPRGAPKYPLQNALAGLAAVPLSLLPQGAAAQSGQGTAPQAGAPVAAGEAPCEVVSPTEPAVAARREMAKTIDLLLWGLAVVFLCTCCPMGLLFSLVLSLGGAALALVIQLAATCQPEMLLQLASTAGLDVWSMIAGLDVSSLLLGGALALAKAAKTLWLLGLDVWSLLAGLVLGLVKLGVAAVLGLVKLGVAAVLGLVKIVKALLLAGLDVWSLLVGGVMGVAKGTRAAWSAWMGRGGRPEQDDKSDAGAGAGSSVQMSGASA